MQEELKRAVRGDFLAYCRRQGADTASQAEAYALAGDWLAECFAAWCPQYLKSKHGLAPDPKQPGPRRGLLIYGEVGRGKTYLARKVYEFYRGVSERCTGSRKAVFVYGTEFYIGSQIRDSGFLDEFFFGNQRKILFFDDLGNEEESRRWGNSFSGREVVRFRSVCREKYGVPTVITTNLNSKTLAEKYGVSVESRVHGDYMSIFLQYPRDRRREQWR